MTAAARHRQAIDPLRERLAGPELEAAASVLEARGVEGLIVHAVSTLEAQEAARARFAALASALSTAPQQRRSTIEAYLRATIVEPRALAADLRALRRGERGVLDLDALGARLARQAASAERAIEVALALAQASFEAAEIESVDSGEPIGDAWLAQIPATIGLASRPGRWSRRVEAIGLLARLGPYAPPRDNASLRDLARGLFADDRQTWVRAAALGLLGAVTPDVALAVACAHMEARAGGDDFLLRERIVELAARGGLGLEGFAAVIAIAAADPSEHVRVTMARAERNSERLARVARHDESPKVRASALITLTTRDDTNAPASLLHALRADPHPLVVRTAAEELTELARHHRPMDLVAAIDALRFASRRAELPADARAQLDEALADVAVLGDPRLRPVRDVLAPIVAETELGTRTRVRDVALAQLGDDDLGRVLSVLSRYDFPLAVDRAKDGVMLHRGDVRSFAPWRALFEVLHPSPSKRQAFSHTWARKPVGELRAPPAGLAELTATRVPGERVLIEPLGTWGRQLPLVDDLLSTTLRRRGVSIFGATGRTRIAPPPTLAGKARAWLRLTLRYPRLVELRRRSLESDEPLVQRAYVDEVSRALGITIDYVPHERGAEPPRGLPAASSERPAPSALRTLPLWLAPIADRLGSPDELWRRMLAYAVSPAGNRLPQLATYSVLLVLAMFARSIGIRVEIDRARKGIPLVIGGWGTRGKSGTERLKAALFQGLGHETLVKTTGCEAMFIHAIPGTPAREVFIHRPYDKATVWEQRDLLLLARDLGVRVFLWECMALQPDLVNLLQAQWMRDDYSTITNAYPDHEDVQGPTGYDVATTIAEFVPVRGTLFTTEEQMLPLLKVKARERDTNLRIVPRREAELLADDLLARFPYREHPSNIALVTALARAMGIPSAIAVAEMADNVVPDLGVLKTYADVEHRGRTLSFTNGMSANERTGALSNWQRTGFDQHDVDVEPARWVVTLVNNRGDRVARSEVFARFLVEDVAAHRHVLIGTNVSGLLGYLQAALDQHLARIAPTAMLGAQADPAGRVHRRIDEAFRALKIGRTDAASVNAELAALGAPTLDAARVDGLLQPVAGETLDAAQRSLEAALTDVEAERRPFVAAAIARRRLVRGVHALVDRALAATPAAIDAAFATAYRALFLASLMVLDDPATSGDQILDAIARGVPPGARATIMGVQNIKGTGLDFVYRWVGLEQVRRWLAGLDDLGNDAFDAREAALRGLLVHGDYGLLDARLALDVVGAAQRLDPRAAELPYAPTLARLQTVVDERTARLARRRTRTLVERARDAVGITFDYLDATRRRWMARDVLRGLVAGRLSHATAATRMRAIVARSRGGWIRPPR